MPRVLSRHTPRCGFAVEGVTKLSGAPGFLGGCGVGFDVFRRVLPLESGPWFAAVWGGYDDNFVAIRFRDAAALGLERVPFVLPESEPDEDEDEEEEPNYSLEIAEVGFYALTETNLRRLGLKSYEDALGLLPETEYRFYSHDDCWFALHAPDHDEALIVDLLRVIVGLQEGYLGIDIPAPDEEAIVNDLLGHLQGHGSITLRSTPGGTSMNAAYERPSDKRWRRLMRHSDTVEIMLWPFETAARPEH